MGIFTKLFGKSKPKAVARKSPKIKRPPMMKGVKGDKFAVADGFQYDDRETVVEYDEGYDYALDPNDVYEFDRDGSGVGIDEDDDDAFFGDNDDDDD